jgi:hypothetical protein
LGGVANTATRLTATANNATTFGEESTGLGNIAHSGRWYLKRITGTGTIEITLDGGTTWTDVTSYVDGPNGDSDLNDYRLRAVEETGTTIRLGIRLGTSGDEVSVGGGEVIANFSNAEIVGLPPMVTFDTAVSQYAVSPVEQTSIWSAAPNWQNFPKLSQLYKFNEGPEAAYAEDSNHPAGADGVENGNFATDSIWTKGAGWAIAGGLASISVAQAGGSALKQGGVADDLSTVMHLYAVFVDSLTGISQVKIGGGGGGLSVVGDLALGYNEFCYKSNNPDTEVQVVATAGASIAVSSVSVQPLTHGIIYNGVLDGDWSR